MSKPRAYDDEETTTTKSLSPELTATMKKRQEAPTLRPTPERHAAPRGRAHETKKTNTPSRFNRTKSCSAPSPDSNKVQLRIVSPSTETKTRDYREQIATLANSPYNYMTTSPYVPVGPLRQHHEDCDKDTSTTRTAQNAERISEQTLDGSQATRTT